MQYTCLLYISDLSRNYQSSVVYQNKNKPFTKYALDKQYSTKMIYICRYLFKALTH